MNRSERLAGTLLTKLGFTHRKRWERTAERRPGWDERNEIIARLIPAGSSVLDVGAGYQSLRDHLDPTCMYQPADLVQKTSDTWLIDFTAGIYPEVPEPFDVVVCSGVLEYAKRPAELLSWMAASGRALLLSYAALSPECPMGNRPRWFNHLTQEELERMFTEAGCTFDLQTTWVTAQCPQLIYRLKC